VRACAGARSTHGCGSRCSAGARWSVGRCRWAWPGGAWCASSDAPPRHATSAGSEHEAAPRRAWRWLSRTATARGLGRVQTPHALRAGACGERERAALLFPCAKLFLAFFFVALLPRTVT